MKINTASSLQTPVATFEPTSRHKAEKNIFVTNLKENHKYE